MDIHNIDLVAATGLGVSILTAVPGFVAIQAQIRNRTPKNNFYEDNDGKSTPESEAAFSNTSSKIATVVCASIALATQLAVAILSLLGRDDRHLAALPDWLITGAWVSFNFY